MLMELAKNVFRQWKQDRKDKQLTFFKPELNFWRICNQRFDFFRRFLAEIWNGDDQAEGEHDADGTHHQEGQHEAAHFVQPGSDSGSYKQKVNVVG